MNAIDHPLNPIPQRLAKLLVKAKDPQLAGRVEQWMGRHSEGLYKHLHTWLDDEGNVDLRRTLGTKACEIIESEEFNRFDE